MVWFSLVLVTLQENPCLLSLKERSVHLISPSSQGMIHLLQSYSWVYRKRKYPVLAIWVSFQPVFAIQSKAKLVLGTTRFSTTSHLIIFFPIKYNLAQYKSFDNLFSQFNIILPVTRWNNNQIQASPCIDETNEIQIPKPVTVQRKKRNFSRLKWHTACSRIDTEGKILSSCGTRSGNYFP